MAPWPTYATDRSRLISFDRGLPKDHTCQVSLSNFAEIKPVYINKENKNVP